LQLKDAREKQTMLMVAEDRVALPVRDVSALDLLSQSRKVVKSLASPADDSGPNAVFPEANEEYEMKPIPR
jgi:hypothetical protein